VASFSNKYPDDWYAEVRRRWAGKAEWVIGNGRYALLEPCRVLTIQLFDSQYEALLERNLGNEFGCGDRCLGAHEVVDLTHDYHPRQEQQNQGLQQ